MEESDSSQENIIYQSDTGGKNQEIICHGKGKAWEEYNMERKFLEGFILWQKNHRKFDDDLRC